MSPLTPAIFSLTELLDIDGFDFHVFLFAEENGCEWVCFVVEGEHCFLACNLVVRDLLKLIT